MTAAHNDRCDSLLGRGCDCRSPWAPDTAPNGDQDRITTTAALRPVPKCKGWVWKARYEQVKAERDTLRDDIKFMGAESEHDSALAFLARQVRAAQDASHRELYAPASYTTHDARVAWADGYTQACVDIRAAMKEAARG